MSDISERGKGARIVPLAHSQCRLKADVWDPDRQPTP